MQIPEWLQQFLLTWFVASVGWGIRVELRLSKNEGRTEGIGPLQVDVKQILMSVAAMASDIKTLYRLVDGQKHEN